jgi:hypothetical protein
MWAPPTIDTSSRSAAGPQSPPARPRRSRARWIVGLSVIVVIVLGGLAGAGLAGRGPLRALAISGASDPGADGEQAASGAPSAVVADFKVGDCLVWNDRATAPGDARVVACDQEHVIEITGSIVLADQASAYPSPSQWATLVHSRCLDLAETAYGAKLDPEGRFTPGGIPPVENDWARGDRKLWCGIKANWVDRPVQTSSDVNQMTPFTGAAKGQEQYWVYKAGDCLGGVTRNPVSCTDPHELEVVGETTLTDRPTVPAVDDVKSWQTLVGTTCDRQVRTYLGKAPKAPWESSYVAITPESWAAGKRNVTCIVASATDGGWSTVTMSAKTANK